MAIRDILDTFLLPVGDIPRHSGFRGFPGIVLTCLWLRGAQRSKWVRRLSPLCSPRTQAMGDRFFLFFVFFFNE